MWVDCVSKSFSPLTEEPIFQLCKSRYLCGSKSRKYPANCLQTKKKKKIEKKVTPQLLYNVIARIWNVKSMLAEEYCCVQIKMSRSYRNDCNLWSYSFVWIQNFLINICYILSHALKNSVLKKFLFVVDSRKRVLVQMHF